MTIKAERERDEKEERIFLVKPKATAGECGELFRFT